MRLAILFFVGFFMGAAMSLIGMSYLKQGTSYRNGVMAVMREQVKALDQSVKANRCAATDLVPRLQTMRHLGNDIEPAFLPTEDDARFQRHATDLRAALDAALASPPLNCDSAAVALDRIGNVCQACHQDFKN